MMVFCCIVSLYCIETPSFSLKDRLVLFILLSIMAGLCRRYVLPSLSRIPNDDEEWIRIAYAAAVGPLSRAAYGFLSSTQNSGTNSEALVYLPTCSRS